jgi:hypothetical protein
LLLGLCYSDRENRRNNIAFIHGFRPGFVMSR